MCHFGWHFPLNGRAGRAARGVINFQRRPSLRTNHTTRDIRGETDVVTSRIDDADQHINKATLHDRPAAKAMTVDAGRRNSGLRRTP